MLLRGAESALPIVLSRRQMIKATILSGAAIGFTVGAPTSYSQPMPRPRESKTQCFEVFAVGVFEEGIFE